MEEVVSSQLFPLLLCYSSSLPGLLSVVSISPMYCLFTFVERKDRAIEGLFLYDKFKTLELVSWLNTNSQRLQTLLTAPRKKCIKNWPAFKSVFIKTNPYGHSSIHHFTQTAVFIPSISPVAAITVMTSLQLSVELSSRQSQEQNYPLSPNSPVLGLAAPLLGCQETFLSLPSYPATSPTAFSLDRTDSLPGFRYSPFLIQGWQTIPPAQASSVPGELTLVWISWGTIKHSDQTIIPDTRESFQTACVYPFPQSKGQRDGKHRAKGNQIYLGIDGHSSHLLWWMHAALTLQVLAKASKFAVPACMSTDEVPQLSLCLGEDLARNSFVGFVQLLGFLICWSCCSASWPSL